MLKGIDPVVSPELLKALAEMGHGDEILFADAHFPGRTNAREPHGNRSPSRSPSARGGGSRPRSGGRALTPFQTL